MTGISPKTLATIDQLVRDQTAEGTPPTKILADIETMIGHILTIPTHTEPDLAHLRGLQAGIQIALRVIQGPPIRQLDPMQGTRDE